MGPDLQAAFDEDRRIVHEERLLELVRRHQHLSLAAISEQVMHALKSWIGAEEQPDDITLVLARQL